MLDSFDREISYLRISVTDKCNLRCTYCMPKEGVAPKKHSDLISFEDIAEIAKVAVRLGIKKIRLTGGEPLVRRGIVNLVAMLSKISDLNELNMTTNGLLLPLYAMDLKNAGLTRVNISLDTLDPARYTEITRIGDISQVLSGIDAAIEAGIPVKINKVALPDEPQDETESVRCFAQSKGLQFQLINMFSLISLPMHSKEDNEPMPEADKFDRPPHCAFCNRLRLLSDGTLKPCLHSDIEIKVDMSDIESSIKQAISAKPKSGGVCLSRGMTEIGG